MKKNLLFALLSFVFFGTSFSQSDMQKLNRFKATTQAQILINELTQTPEFIRLGQEHALNITGNSIKEKTTNFLSQYQDILGVASTNFKISKIIKDVHGFSHVNLIQEYQNVPVFDGQLKLHFNALNKLTSVNGNIMPILKVKTVPSITIQRAKNKALELVNNQNINNSNQSLFVFKEELFVYRKGLVQNGFKGNYLTYKIEVRNNADVREYLFIDAHTGELVEQFTGMAHAMDREVYENNTDAANLVWEEGDALPGSLDIWQQNEVIASGHTYRFFENAFGFLSYDGNDAKMITINNNPNIACPNATWNGVSANYCNGTATDDVIAHEWGHAYTEYTSGLIYAYQSGALNESYSDIWGETIDLLNNYEDAGENLSARTNCNNSLRWQVGEDATAFGGAIRDMYFPTCDNDPGKVTDGVYRCGAGDFGGVHSNSGVPNHAYALLVDGGNYNGQNINGIGFVKAAHIFWRAQSQYLTATSDFFVFADALEASGNDLLGINLEGLSTTDIPAGPSGEIITAADLAELSKVILAVEFRINPDACGYQPLLTDDPTLCSNATSSPLFVEDWESGMTSWIATQHPVNSGTWEARDWTLETNLPKNRVGNGVLGPDPINGNCSTDLQNGILRLESPIISTPSTGVTDYQLAFNHNVSSEYQWDGFNIKYRLNSGTWTLLPQSAFTSNGYNFTLRTTAQGNDNPMQGETAFTGSDEGGNTGSWVTSVVDLTTIGLNEDDTIQFRFEVGTDGCNGTVGWYLDEIYLYSCSTALGVDSFSNLDSNLSVFPNPSNGIYTLNNDSQIELEFAHIYDINGRLIKTIQLTEKNSKTEINLNSFANGVYFMNVVSKSSNKTFKLIKK